MLTSHEKREKIRIQTETENEIVIKELNEKIVMLETQLKTVLQNSGEVQVVEVIKEIPTTNNMDNTNNNTNNTTNTNSQLEDENSELLKQIEMLKQEMAERTSMMLTEVPEDIPNDENENETTQKLRSTLRKLTATYKIIQISKEKLDSENKVYKTENKKSKKIIKELNKNESQLTRTIKQLESKLESRSRMKGGPAEPVSKRPKSMTNETELVASLRKRYK